MLSCQQDKPDHPEPWEPPPKGPPGVTPGPGEEERDGDVLEGDPPPPEPSQPLDTPEPWEPPPKGPVG